jgi:hypothetical protein
MAPQQGEVKFPGFQHVLGAHMTFCRGSLPSVCLLRMLPQINLRTDPGTLEFTYGTKKVALQNVVPDFATLRIFRGRSGHRWSVVLYDRRINWRNHKVGGKYNVRLRDGFIDSRVGMQDMCKILLDAMAETGYDVSAMPNNVYPPADWESDNPGRELEWLCDRVAGTIVLGLDDRVKLWPIGSGPDLPSDSTALLPDYKFASAYRPDRLVIAGGPTWFQHRFALEAVGLDTNGAIVPIDRLSYMPAGGWGREWWGAFAGVDRRSRHLAFDTVWRWYRVKGMANGGLQVPGSSEQVTSIDQYVLDDHLVQMANDNRGVRKLRPAHVQGTYWPHEDLHNNTGPCTRYNGEFKILKQHNIVEFEYPAFKIISGQKVPAELYLSAGFHLRKTNGELACYQRALSLGSPRGAGDEIFHRPELFDSVVQLYNSCTTLGRRASTVLNIDAEADRYLRLLRVKYDQMPLKDRTWLGIEPIDLSGKISQIRWSTGRGLNSLTRASGRFEFDDKEPSALMKRRIQKLYQMAEKDRLLS